MKKVSRLLNYKAQKAKDAQYNAFGAHVEACSTRSSKTKSKAKTKPPNKSAEPTVHNYGKTVAPTKPKAKSLQQPKRQLPPDDSINYAALNRMRNSSSTVACDPRLQQKLQRRQRSKRRWWKWRRYLCCGKTKRAYSTQRSYKGYWRQPAKPRRSIWGFRWRPRCCRTRSSYQYDSEEDDDIDGKFAAYICEMQEKEAASATAAAEPQTQSTPNLDLQVDAAVTTSSVEVLVAATVAKEATDACVASASPHIARASFPFRRRSQSQTRPKRRAWTWDDSLRSNSDRFLETLEEDELNVAGVCNFARKAPVVCVPSGNGGREEAKAAAEELSRSPVMGQRNDPASSPIQSRTSNDAWPAQSDEDIDRLVAMHQNRSSLSSLGLRSDSMASVYSGAGEGRYGTVVVKGQVEFGMQYNYKLGALEIHVVRCKDLAAVDAKRNRSDPYVKVYLLPDKSKAGKRKTKVKKHTLNPIFDEVLRFHMPISSLETRSLWLTVWHSDMFGRNDFLGEVSVNLQGRVFDNPQSQWYLLQERSEPFEDVATYRGDIVVGLKYVPPECLKSGFLRGSSTTGSSSNLRKFGSIKSVTTKSDRSAKGGQLHVLVKEAKHLSPIKANGTCDAFCKSYLLPDRSRNSKQKTPVIKRSLHPSWNYTFVYEDVSLEDLSERALELTVWDHDRLASNEFVGGIRFSLGTGKSYGRHVEWMDATGKELSLWQNMLDRPNFWVEGSLVLRSTLDGIRAIP